MDILLNLMIDLIILRVMQITIRYAKMKVVTIKNIDEYTIFLFISSLLASKYFPNHSRGSNEVMKKTTKTSSSILAPSGMA